MKIRNQGFTLIELLVVISIIAILSAIILVSLATARSRGSTGLIQQEAIQLRNAIELGWNGSAYKDLTGNTGSGVSIADNTFFTSGVSTIANKILSQNPAGYYAAQSVVPSCVGTHTFNADSILAVYTGSSYFTTNPLTIYVDTSCGLATKYAIYAAYGPTVGSNGYFCIDSKGNSLSKKTGYFLPTPSQGSSPICQ